MADINEKVNNEYGGSEIQVLEGLEAVRKRPGMYIGNTSNEGLHHLVYEIVDNSIDEALAGYCNHIEVTIEPGDIICVSDNGRGIPVDIQPQTGKPALEVVFTVLHAGGKFGGGGYKVSGGLHGVGASVVNALSEWLTVQVHRDGKIYQMSFSRGNMTEEMHIVGETDHTGTTVRFKPDSEMFDTLVYKYDILHKRMREQAFLNAGLRITITDKREGMEENHESMCYEGGIREYVSYLNKHRELIHNDVIYVSGYKDETTVEIALQYNEGFDEQIISFANDIRTPEGGMHETGFKTALTKVINNYVENKNNKNNSKKKTETIKFSGEDVRNGIAAIISVKLPEPQFEGQTKQKLGNSYVRGLVESIVNEQLAIYFEENPATAGRIIDKATVENKARIAAETARKNVRNVKSALDSGQMPDKLQDCNEKDPSLCEIYIVEGDSAAGSAIQGRDSRFQAILAMWGKMLNVEKARPDKVFNNDKLNPLICALGTGIGKEKKEDDSEGGKDTAGIKNQSVFNIDKLRYHKIIIMADADVDGSHIRTLLLTFFYRYMRPLVERGYVYSAVPPLYKLTRGKTTRVAYSDDERDRISAEMRENNPNAKIDISRFKGLGEMDPHELWETTMDPEKRTLRRITLEDADAANEIFSMLMGDDVEPRRNWIEENARDVVNLDI